MRIAIYNPRISYFIGGSELTTIEFAKMLSEKHDVTVITSDNKKTENFQGFENGYKDIHFNYFKCPMSIDFKSTEDFNGWDHEGIFFGESTSEFFETNNFDLIVTFYSTDLVTLNKRDSKVLLHLQGHANKIKKIDSLAFPEADFIVANSNYVSDKIKSMYRINVDRVYLSGPNPKDYVHSEIKRDIDLIYLGRLTERKGADLLIESLSPLRDLFDKCIIAGTGEIEGELKRLIRDYDLEDKVELVGVVEKSKAIELLGRSKLFILPAKTKEPCPKSIIEALFMGCVVISTRVGGIPEIVNSSTKGILIEPNNSQILSKTIGSLLRDNGKVSGLSSSGEIEIREEYNHLNKLEEFLSLYEELMGGIKNGKN